MYEYRIIHQIIFDIHQFVIDYIKVSKINSENSNLLAVQLGDEKFLLPATLNNFSQRADELQIRLQTQIRILAQKRRNDILKGIDYDVQHQNQSYNFDENLKIHLEQNKSDKIIQYLQSIISALELYNEIQTQKSSTFCLLPILKYIQKQLCCISINIQKTLDYNKSHINQHLKNIQQKISLYDMDMKKKLSTYISNDIRTPVLVIPCPQCPN